MSDLQVKQGVKQYSKCLPMDILLYIVDRKVPMLIYLVCHTMFRAAFEEKLCNFFS